MSLIKFRNTSHSLNDPFQSFFDDFFAGEIFQRPLAATRNSATPAANISEDEKAFRIEVAVPGFSKEDVKIELEEDVLQISAEKKSEREVNEEKYAVREFGYTRFSRRFRLPKAVNFDAIKATASNGILRVEVPKAAPVSNTRTIQID